jgi:hypothetical protein
MRSPCLLCLAQGLCQGTHAAFREDKLPERRLESGVEVPLRHAPDKHLHDETLERRAGLGQRGPELRTIRVLEPAHLGDFHPQDAFRRLAGAVLIPMAMAVSPWVALVAAAPQDCGLLPFSGLLYHPLCRQLH